MKYFFICLLAFHTVYLLYSRKAVFRHIVQKLITNCNYFILLVEKHVSLPYIKMQVSAKHVEMHAKNIKNSQGKKQNTQKWRLKAVQ